ncbi:hypothetical protein ES332_D05G254800v1 [Gossypium tomentosum]|uniref:Uncharacterized protein n=1 Tax=Gossypium tomentosum TaxID=34277 RepID=A0A5D2L037_GOSTO|nr:hypothetical protein ES332_D05G254800v1 [Gossypium tomentosum]
MSERASLFLSSIGLLGEYCPTSRKKNRSSYSEISCMHIEANQRHSLGFRFMQHLPSARRQPGNRFLTTILITSI